MGPNPREGEITGELSVGLMTENGEPKMLVGLLEAELLGCCEDMASKLPSGEDDVPSEGSQSKMNTKEKLLVILHFLTDHNQNKHLPLTLIGCGYYYYHHY